jgi:hypothetical protein
MIGKILQFNNKTREEKLSRFLFYCDKELT